MIVVRNDIFQRNLAVTLGIYWELSVQNIIHIRLDLTFLLHDVWGPFVTGHSVEFTQLPRNSTTRDLYVFYIQRKKNRFCFLK